MQPLTPAEHIADQDQIAAAHSRSGIVLPRMFRKPVRQLRRLFNGGFRVTRRGMGISALAFVLVAGAAGVHYSGGGEAVMARMAPGLGIAISKIEVSGNRELSDEKIGRIVAPGESISILGYDVAEAREKLKELSWVADAAVSRVYPDTLVIEIDEREPFALWQSENGLQMIDSDGLVLEAYDGRAHSMPLLVGRGAEKSADDFVALMNQFPAIASMAKAYVMVGERRWDVELTNGVTIMLPENGMERELANLIELDRKHALLARDISRVDLRLADRMIVRVSDDAKEILSEKRKEQLKLLTASAKERNI